MKKAFMQYEIARAVPIAILIILIIFMIVSAVRGAEPAAVGSEKIVYTAVKNTPVAMEESTFAPVEITPDQEVTTSIDETVSESDEMVIRENDIPVEVTPEPHNNLYYDVPLSRDLQDYILEICEEYGVNHLIVLGMIEYESGFDTETIGDSGEAFGLMQVQPQWHRDRMNKLGVTDLLDPYQNVLVGVDYLAELMSWGNGLEWALMAYNGGPTYANRKAAAGEVSNYVTTVLTNAECFDVKE